MRMERCSEILFLYTSYAFRELLCTTNFSISIPLCNFNLFETDVGGSYVTYVILLCGPIEKENLMEKPLLIEILEQLC